MSSNAILVTGGAGYVGAHTCKALSRGGYLPVVIDNLSTGHESFVRWGPLIQADIRDTDAVTNAINTFNVDAVLHFAASAYVGESVLDPQKYYENNVAGALALLAGMLAVGCRKIIVSSTCAVYGEPAEIPIRGGRTEAADKSVRCIKGHGRANPRRLYARLLAKLGHAEIFQCLWRRSRRRRRRVA